MRRILMGVKTNHNAGFTLAEVLITLGIIGVVAAMTIPTLMTNQREKVTITKVQKAYSVLSQAYLAAVDEYGPPSTWADVGRNMASAKIVRDNIFSKTKVSVKCDDGSDRYKCGIAPLYKYMNGSNETETAESSKKSSAVMTVDGTGFLVLTNQKEMLERGTTLPLKWVTAFIFVDTNGTAKPNIHGKDMFAFWLTDYGIIPIGDKGSTFFPFNKDCKNTGFGHGCTVWVVKAKNLKYLHSHNCDLDSLSCE